MPGTTVIDTTSSDHESRPISYNAYGYASTSKTRATRLLYNGELFLDGIYLLGLGYRAYSPTLMRFHSADAHSPFGDGGLNAYAYCLGDPANWLDPSGRAPVKQRIAHVPKPQSKTIKKSSTRPTPTPAEHSLPTSSTSSTAARPLYNSRDLGKKHYMNEIGINDERRDPYNAHRNSPSITPSEAAALHDWNKHRAVASQGLSAEKSQLVIFTAIESRATGKNVTSNIRSLNFKLTNGQISDFVSRIGRKLQKIRKATQPT